MVEGQQGLYEGSAQTLRTQAGCLKVPRAKHCKSREEQALGKPLQSGGEGWGPALHSDALPEDSAAEMTMKVAVALG